MTKLLTHPDRFLVSAFAVLAAFCLVFPAHAETVTDAAAAPDEATETVPADTADIPKVGPYRLRIGHLVQDARHFRIYPNALPTLLRTIRERTSLNIDPDPIVFSSFEDPIIFELPMLYINFGQRENWELTPLEVDNLKTYLERGGFIHVDAGITAEFLRNKPGGQSHSFAEWDARPELKDIMRQVFPTKTFKPLPRSHDVYRIFYDGLPDAAILPDTVREFVVNEKWPQGTYSMVGLEVKGRLAMVASPIIAMGWGKTQIGTWETTIGFRIREGGEKLDERLNTAAYSGERFEVTREDKAKDVIYCQESGIPDEPGRPAWVREPDGYRVFRYYHSREISDYAHTFYTQLGVNLVLFSMIN